MPGYSPVPVDYQPDFDDSSIVPAADGIAQQPQIQQARPSRKAGRSNSHQREPLNPMPLRRPQGVF
jgi:hypothetical protein